MKIFDGFSRASPINGLFVPKDMVETRRQIRAEAVASPTSVGADAAARECNRPEPSLSKSRASAGVPTRCGAEGRLD
jgi:hypothetical protein